MSHAPERTEKNCLNCGATVIGRFCHICGQENIEPKETVWQLITHFFNDITHFDGKFFTTLKDLIIKPGFLSKEYMIGRRASYLNPVRMYVFTSAIFFLIFFTFFYSHEITLTNTTINGKTLSQVNKMDSATFAAFTTNINEEAKRPAVPMTRGEFKRYYDSVGPGSVNVDLTTSSYKTRQEYDTAIHGAREDGWLKRQVMYKAIDLNQKYHNNSTEILGALRNTFVHTMPQIFFISLPLLALILKLFYVRRKQFYYVSHGIFSIHLYIFLFIAMLVLFSLGKLNASLHWGLLSYLGTFIVIGIFVYQYISMKKFYRQGWIKTFFKFLLTDILFFFVIILLFIIFAVFSFFNI